MHAMQISELKTGGRVMGMLEAKVKVGNYLLLLSAAPTADGRWEATYEVRPASFAGVSIEGPVQLDQTFERAADAVSAASAAGRRSIEKHQR